MSIVQYPEPHYVTVLDMNALLPKYLTYFKSLTQDTFDWYKAPFIWRKVVPGKRVTLLAESTLPSVYMRKKLTPLPEPRANFPITTELAHALIVSP